MPPAAAHENIKALAIQVFKEQLGEHCLAYAGDLGQMDASSGDEDEHLKGKAMAGDDMPGEPDDRPEKQEEESSKGATSFQGNDHIVREGIARPQQSSIQA